MIAIARAILMGLVRLLIGARGAWVGVQPVERQRIYFANHASHFDTVAVLAALPPALRHTTRPVAAKDYWNKSALRRLVAIDCLRSILIDRTRTSDGDPLAPVHAVLAAGDSILIFPEGTRAGDGAIAAFKSGLYRLAQAFPEVELVPVHLDNLARIMPKGSYLIVPITCTARFGAPLRITEGEAKEPFLDRAREAVQSLARPAP